MRRVALVIAVAALVVAGCGGSDGATSGPELSSGEGPAPQRDRSDREREARAGASLEPARCPESAGNCQAATGRVIYIESVDPDGDGDLHVVLLGGGSLSAPGVTVLDVAPGLRPARDPAPGDLVTGAGPVFRGSYGQRQIQVNTFRTAG